MQVAEDTMRAAFEFTTKLGAPFWAFHDRDIAPEGGSLKESNERLDKIVRLARSLQKDTGVKLLWHTVGGWFDRDKPVPPTHVKREDGLNGSRSPS